MVINLAFGSETTVILYRGLHKADFTMFLFRRTQKMERIKALPFIRYGLTLRT